MAGLQQRSGSFRVFFRYQGRQRVFPLGKISRQEAEAKAAQVDYLLLRLEQRLLALPPGVDIVEFLQFDGKPPSAGPAGPQPVTNLVTLRDRYLATHATAQEAKTLYTARIHFSHLIATLGERFPLAELTLPDLQRHVERRSQQGIATVTIKKELQGFRAAWNWGRRSGLVRQEWPGQGLVYPKAREKPPFQTRAEIARRLARGGLTEEQEAELWESLYLTADELAALLSHVASAARHSFIYPMFCLAAHTGARRSELLRASVSDVDFEGGVITIHEKKRVRGCQTTRRVPLSPFLEGVLKEWLAAHPGGAYLFCHAGVVDRSRKRGRTTGHRGEKTRASSLKGRLAGVRDREQAGISPLTDNEAAHHFEQTLAGSEWSVLTGWHVLRHSFASICASRGIDQRLINLWMGHQTEEQQRRYQHLFPQTQQTAMRQAFG